MNRLSGTIVACRHQGHLWRVVTRVGVVEMTAVLIDFAGSDDIPTIGMSAAIQFKEAETALAHDVPVHSISIRNRLPCIVGSVDDDGILATVKLDFGGNALTSLITSESAADLSIAPGSPIYALVKSTEVMMDRKDA